MRLMYPCMSCGTHTVALVWEARPARLVLFSADLADLPVILFLLVQAKWENVSTKLPVISILKIADKVPWC